MNNRATRSAPSGVGRKEGMPPEGEVMPHEIESYRTNTSGEPGEFAKWAANEIAALRAEVAELSAGRTTTEYGVRYPSGVCRGFRSQREAFYASRFPEYEMVTRRVTVTEWTTVPVPSPSAVQ